MTVAALLVSSAALLAQQPPPAPQPAPQGQLTGVITESGFSQVAIAVPPCKTDVQGAAAAQEIVSVLTGDLTFSGYFRMVEPSLYAGMNTGDAQVDFDAWKGMNADYLLLTSLYASGPQLSLEGRLFDVKRKEMVTGKRIKGPAQDSRLLGHNLASVILDYLFGAGSFPTSQILFTSHLGTTEDIFLCDYDGRNIVRLTAMGQLNVTPDVSPGGDKIAFTSILKDRQELFLLDRQGRRTKIYGGGEGLNSNPRFSHDGKTIAFATSKSGNPDVWSIGVDGKNLTRLTFSWAIDTAPTWSPDDQHLAFTSDRSGSPQIYVMDRDGANVRRLSPEGSGRCDQPAWSPRGDKIAYATLRDGHYDVAVIDLNTNEVTFLTSGGGNNEAPCWSPDGRYLAFASNRSGTYQIYIMRWDGSGVTRITQQPDCYGPCWFKG
jgi:TolB protein